MPGMDTTNMRSRMMNFILLQMALATRGENLQSSSLI